MKSTWLMLASLVVLSLMETTTSFLNILSSKNCFRSSRLLDIPSWADLGPIMAQLTLTPAVIYYVKNQMQNEIGFLNRKVEALEELKRNISAPEDERNRLLAEAFSVDMQDAVVAYQRLYGGTNAKMADVMSKEERRTAFESEIVQSILELQSVADDVNELKKEREILLSDIERSTEAMTESNDALSQRTTRQGLALSAMQREDKDGAELMQLDSRRELEKSIKEYQKTVSGLKTKIKELGSPENTGYNGDIVYSQIAGGMMEELYGNSESDENIVGNAFSDVLTNEQSEKGMQQYDSIVEQVKSIEQSLEKSQEAILVAERQTRERLVEMNEKKSNDVREGQMKLNAAQDKVSKLRKVEEEIESIRESRRIKTEQTKDSEVVKERSLISTADDCIENLELDVERVRETSKMIDEMTTVSELSESLIQRDSENLSELSARLEEMIDDTVENTIAISDINKEIQAINDFGENLEDRMVSLETKIEITDLAQKSSAPQLAKLVEDASEVMRKIEISAGDESEILPSETESSLQAVKVEESEIEELLAENEEIKKILNIKEMEALKGISNIEKGIDNFNEGIDKIQKSSTNEMALLKSRELGVHTDFVDSIEVLQDKQSGVNEQTKISVIRSETNFRQKNQLMLDKEEMNEQKLEIAKKNFENSVLDINNLIDDRDKLQNVQYEKMDTKINAGTKSLETLVDMSIAETVKKDINAFNENISEQFREEKSEILDEQAAIITLSAGSETAKLAALREMENSNNLKLGALVAKEDAKLRRGVDEKMEVLRSDIDSSTSSLRQSMDDVDEEVEEKVKAAVERNGLRSAVKRISKKTISKVADGVTGIGRGIGSFGAYLIGRGDFED